MALLEMSISASLLIVVALLLRKVANKFITRKAILFLWNLILVRALIPFHIPLEKIPFLREKVESLSAVMIPTARPAVTVATAALAEKESTAARTLGIQELLMLIWIIGFLVMLIRFLKNCLLQTQMIKDFEPLKFYDSMITREIRQFGLRRDITVLLCQCIKSPITYGIRHPKILISEEFLRIPRRQRISVLKHELIHIKRFDVVMRNIVEIAVCVHWFNPLMRIMRESYLTDQEISCDELVVRYMDIEERKDYSRTLLEMVNGKKEEPSSLPSFFEKKLVVKQRIKAILDYKRMGIGGIAIIALIFSVSLLSFASYTPTAISTESKNGERNVQQTDINVQEQAEAQTELNAQKEIETETASTVKETETENNINQRETDETDVATAEEETEFVRMSDEEYERVMNDIIENYNDFSVQPTEEQIRAVRLNDLYNLAERYKEKLENGETLSERESYILSEYGN